MITECADRLRRHAWALVLLGALPALARADAPREAPPNPAFAAEAEHVVIVSFDGLRPDVIDKAGMRTLQKLRRVGTYTDSARAVYPSLTLINHASMIAGVGPEKHGIDWNRYRPGNGALKVPTVFDLAKKAGLRTALVAGKWKLAHLNREGTIDRFVVEDGSPREVALAAISIFERHRPHLMLIHFRHPDSAGHASGWLSDAQLQAAREADRALGDVIDALDRLGLGRRTAFIVSADHGGEGKRHGSRAAVDMTIPWIAAGAEITDRGPLRRPVTTYDTAATAADLLELEVPANWDGASVFRPATAPARR